MKKAVVLLSGGLDSATVMAIAASEGYDLHALTFDYGQKNVVEVESARRVATAFGVEDHRIASIDLGLFGGSALTDDIEVPKSGPGAGIPVTYVPARNTIFLSFALAFAEVIGCCDIFVGVNAVDYSGYPDCRPEYVQAYQTMANLATKMTSEGDRRVRIRTPLMELSKAGIIRLGTSLGLDYSITHSCYSPSDAGESCGQCDTCILRKKGFEAAGIQDPTIYVRS